MQCNNSDLKLDMVRGYSATLTRRALLPVRRCWRSATVGLMLLDYHDDEARNEDRFVPSLRDFSGIGEVTESRWLAELRLHVPLYCENVESHDGARSFR